MIGPRGMRQRFLKQRQVLEPIAEDFLEFGEVPGLVAMNRWGHGRTHKAQKGLRR